MTHSLNKSSALYVPVLLLGASAVALFFFNSSTQSALPRLLLLLLSAVFALIALGPFITLLLTNRGDFFEPSPAYLLFFCLYSISYPIACALDPSKSPWPLELILKAELLCFSGLIAFRVGHAFGIRPAVFPRVRPSRSRPHLPNAYFLSYGLLAVGLLLFVAFLLDVGTTNYLLTTYADTYLIDRGRGHFRVGTVLAQTALVLLYGLSLVDRRSHAYRSVIVYSGYGLLVFFNLLIGRRGPIVELLLPTIVLHHYLAGRLAPRRIGSLLCLGLLAMLAFAYIRGLTSWDVPTLSGHISDESSLSWFDPSENEFGAPYKFVLPDLLDRVPRGLDYWWGRSYSDALQTLVPRMFFAGRVLTVGEWYAATFHAQEWALGFGYGFFVVGEAYLNFGLIGPPFIMFMYGVVLGAVYRRLIRERPGVFSVVVYSLVFVWAVIAMNADFAHQLKSICLMKLVPVSVVILLSSESDWRLDPPSTTPRALGRATGI